MAAAPHLPISVSEYLHTSYRPDCDYVDGVIEERNLGELEHSELQGELLRYLSQHGREWGVRAYLELRIQVSPTRFRVADISIISRQAPRESVIQTPPVAIIEILSPEDRFSRYTERLDDYRRMGIENIWVVDPVLRKGFDCSTGNWIETANFAVSNSSIHVDLGAIFAAIDEEHSR
jgi:Uma2 family endonuclease